MTVILQYEHYSSSSRILSSLPCPPPAGLSLLLYKLTETTGHTNLSVLCKIDLENFSIILESKGSHSKDDIFSIDSLSLLLMTLLRSYNQYGSAQG